MTETYEFKRLKAIFEGDGSDIREQFIFAGLLLTIFERFKKYVVEQVDGFFSNHFNIIDGKLQYTRGEKSKPQQTRILIRENMTAPIGTRLNLSTPSSSARSSSNPSSATQIEKLGILCYKTRGPKSTTAAVRAI
jgi:hypothetical protein